MVQDNSKKCTDQRGRNSNPVAMLPHAAVVFRMQPFNFHWCLWHTFFIEFKVFFTSLTSFVEINFTQLADYLAN